MKKSLFYVGMLLAASFGLTACSSSDDDLTPEVKPGQSQYVSIDVRNVVTTPASKAETYTSASEAESKLGKVRFYFFNSDGSAFSMANSNVAAPTTATNNYVEHDFTNDNQTTQSGNPADGTIERKTEALLVLNGVNGGTPSQVVAINNPDLIESLGTDAKTLTELEAASLQTSKYANDDNTNFLMSSSVYSTATTTGSRVCAASTEGKIYTDPTAARENPVEIYVERVAAKVTAGHAETGWTNLTVDGASHPAYLVQSGLQYLDGTEYKSIDVYAAVLGWGLADEQSTASVLKNIGTSYGSWTDTEIVGTGNGAWTTNDYHRCFWEITPTFSAKSQPWNAYVPAEGAKALDNGTSICYTLPNTIQSGTTIENANRNANFTNNTKIVVACKLVDGEGNPLTICQDLSTGIRYIGLDNMKSVILNRIKGQIYKGTETEKTDLDANDIDFVEDNAGGNETAGSKDYEVKAQLKKTEGTTYYASNAEGAEAMSDDAFTTLANTVANYRAVIYNGGRTYYYTTIQHLAATDAPETLDNWLTATRPMGWFGVVRNHWYQVNILSLSGLGTAVYNPDRYIRPVTPSNTLSYMAARINVLQWRVVTQNVDIDGTGRNNN